MRATAPLSPAFGQADLSNCEREQIHLAGTVQPHGALLVLAERDFTVLQASANAAAFLNIAFDVRGKRLGEFAGDLADKVRAQLGSPLHAVPIALRCRIGAPPVEYDGLLHRPLGGGLIVELERAGPTVDLSRHVEEAVNTIVGCSSLRTLCDEAARLFKDLTGYDRVMVYRFDDNGHGEVFSERREPQLEAFLGNRYPATDIPQIARKLYERNRVRVLVDVGYEPVGIVPRLSPVTGQDLDMSLCFLRSMSPIHIQYLKNMGVCATLVASLMVGGRLWGLIACHHYVPRFAHFEIRAVCELLAETISTRIAALESFAQAQSELSVRRLEQRMIEAISRDGEWRSALFDNAQSLLQILNCGGAVLHFEGNVMVSGEVPSTGKIRAIARWLDTRPERGLYATVSLGNDAPEFASLASIACGLVAVPISSSPGDYLIWFRPELVRTVTWGGNPYKAVIIGDDPRDLSPRRSFAQWHQLVEGTSAPWSPAELTAARLLGESVADVVLQFRSVRFLIAQDQLSKVGQQVRESDQPLIVADAAGRILLTNDSFDRLLSTAHPHLQMIDDILPFFADSMPLRERLNELVRHGRSWRGEVALKSPLGELQPFMLRADPVMSAPQRALGFVLLFTDLARRKAVESARRRLQREIIEQHRVMPMRLDSKSDILFRNLMTSIVANAQLAAFEITEGGETVRLPEMLESIRASVTRAAEVLGKLVLHASQPAKKDG